MQLIKNKQKGFSILAIILVIVAVIVAIGIWALSGSSNVDNNNGSYDTLATSIINDGAVIKDTYDRYLIQGINGDNIIYKPGISSTESAPNILDSLNGITAPISSSKAFRSGFSFPEGTWLYTNGYEDPSSYLADAPAVILVGINDNTCKAINKVLYGINDIPNGSGTFTSLTSGVTQQNPNIAIMDISIDFNLFPQLTDWRRGCVKIENKQDQNVYFQVMQNHS